MTLSVLVLSQYPNLIQQTILSKKFSLGTEELGLGEENYIICSVFTMSRACGPSDTIQAIL